MKFVLIMLSWGVWCVCYQPHELATFNTEAECKEALKRLDENTRIGEAKARGNFVCGVKP